MRGIVNKKREATLAIVVANETGKRQLVNAVIDTGFNGFLTLPPSVITGLNLSWNMSEIATLGDGSETIFDIYKVNIIWDGQYKAIDVGESETVPLIGMALLDGYRLQIDTVEGGAVIIQALAV